MTSLIKVVLAMHRMVIPPQPNFRNPSPLIDWDRLPVRVTAQATEWPYAAGRPPRAGISAFGISGANAHVLVEGYGAPGDAVSRATEMHAPVGAVRRVPVSRPEPVETPVPSDGLTRRTTRFLPLSGKSHEALRELAGRYVSWLDERTGRASPQSTAPEPLPSDMAWTAGVGRSHFSHRAGVVFDDPRSLREGLRALVRAEKGREPRP